MKRMNCRFCEFGHNVFGPHMATQILWIIYRFSAHQRSTTSGILRLFVMTHDWKFIGKKTRQQCQRKVRHSFILQAPHVYISSYPGLFLHYKNLEPINYTTIIGFEDHDIRVYLSAPPRSWCHVETHHSHWHHKDRPGPTVQQCGVVEVAETTHTTNCEKPAEDKQL